MAEYDPSQFVKPAVTADCLIFAGGGRKVLCVRRGNHPCIEQWALPGGFCEKGESSEDSAARELFEETGHRFSGLRQLCFVSTPNRDPRDWIMTIVYTAQVLKPFAVKGCDDAADAVWLDITVTGNDNKKRVTLTGRDADGGGVYAYSDLKIVRDPSGRIDINKTTADNHGIAFDHSKLILFGIESLAD